MLRLFDLRTDLISSVVIDCLTVWVGSLLDLLLKLDFCSGWLIFLDHPALCFAELADLSFTIGALHRLVVSYDGSQRRASGLHPDDNWSAMFKTIAPGRYYWGRLHRTRSLGHPAETHVNPAIIPGNNTEVLVYYDIIIIESLTNMILLRFEVDHHFDVQPFATKGKCLCGQAASHHFARPGARTI